MSEQTEQTTPVAATGQDTLSRVAIGLPDDPLNRKIIGHLADRVILKPLTRWNEAYKEFPRYVMEYLVSRYVDADAPVGGQRKIDKILSEHYSESAKKELIKSRIKEQGQYTFISKRPCFTDDEWIDLLVQSIGFNPVRFDRRTKMLMLLRLVPFVESNHNLIELGPRETGKTYTFRNTSNRSFVVSGGKATPATLFYNKGTRKLGVIGLKHVVFFDEIANTRFDDAESSISVLKDDMQTGQFSRGDQEFSGNAETSYRPTGDNETRGVPGCGFPFLGDRVPVGGTVTRCSGLTLGIGAR